MKWRRKMLLYITGQKNKNIYLSGIQRPIEQEDENFVRTVLSCRDLAPPRCDAVVSRRASEPRRANISGNSSQILLYFVLNIVSVARRISVTFKQLMYGKSQGFLLGGKSIDVIEKNCRDSSFLFYHALPGVTNHSSVNCRRTG